MDLAFWLYGLLAIVIAVSLSSVELLTKYEARTPREIFYSPYYFGFALLNAFFCFLFYLALPHLSGLFIKSELFSATSHPLVRSIAAGLGYLLVVRTSILDLKTPRSNQTLGVGFDAIYNSLAQYLLRQHSKAVREKMRNDFAVLYRGDSNDAIVFLASVTRLIQQANSEERKNVEDKLDLALSGKPPANHLCFSLYLIIRDETVGIKAASELVEGQRKELAIDAQLSENLRKQLPWIYDG